MSKNADDENVLCFIFDKQIYMYPCDKHRQGSVTYEGNARQYKKIK